MTIETVAAQHDSSSDSENEQGNASKTERKARKSMLKMGLVPVPGVTRVTIRRTNKSLFAISTPDVYRTGDTYVVFGEAKVEDASTIQQRANQAQKKSQEANNEFEEESAEDEDDEEEVVEEEEGEAQDETGIEDKDIQLVISQTSCSRAEAVKALKDNENDIVSAVMALTV